MKKERVAIGVLAATLLIVLIAFGVIVQPLKAARYLYRKQVHVVDGIDDKFYTHGLTQIALPWEIRYPNVNLTVISYGGFGNSLMSLACAFEACLYYGLRPPMFSYEKGGDFDFHKLGKPSQPFDDAPMSLNEFYPYLNSVITNSFMGSYLISNSPAIWRARELKEFPLKQSVIQITDFRYALKISDQAFNMVSRSINPKIFDYIRRNYNIGSDTMAVHLRLGQPTDDFVPPSPSPGDIVKFHQEMLPRKVLVFTDNKEKALTVMQQTSLEYDMVNDVNYIECLLMSMCSSAIISESTFSASACRMGNIKKVRLPHTAIGVKQDEEWTVY